MTSTQCLSKSEIRVIERIKSGKEIDLDNYQTASIVNDLLFRAVLCLVDGKYSIPHNWEEVATTIPAETVNKGDDTFTIGCKEAVSIARKVLFFRHNIESVSTMAEDKNRIYVVFKSPVPASYRKDLKDMDFVRCADTAEGFEQYYQPIK